MTPPEFTLTIELCHELGYCRILSAFRALLLLLRATLNLLSTPYPTTLSFKLISLIFKSISLKRLLNIRLPPEFNLVSVLIVANDRLREVFLRQSPVERIPVIYRILL